MPIWSQAATTFLPTVLSCSEVRGGNVRVTMKRGIDVLLLHAEDQFRFGCSVVARAILSRTNLVTEASKLRPPLSLVNWQERSTKYTKFTTEAVCLAVRWCGPMRSVPPRGSGWVLEWN